MKDSVGRTVGRLISRKLLPRRPYPVMRGPLKGIRFILGALSGDGAGASVYLGEVEPEHTRAFCSTLSTGMVFFDVGANVGYYSLLAARLVGATGSVVAFEPSVRNLSYLHRHLEINSFNNVQVLPFAVSDRNGVASFDRGRDHAMGSIAAKGSGDQLVSTVTLDDVVRKLHIRPDVVKIDVEGAELSVLQGANELLADVRPKIFISTHSAELRESCLSLLRNLQYSVKPLGAGDTFEFLAEG